MKNLTFTFFTMLFALSSIAQCEDGRFRNFVFANHTLTPAVTYGSNLDFQGVEQELQLDIYEPAGDVATDRPLVIVAHGGFFIAGSRDGDDVVPLCEDLAKMGYVVASITYRLGIPITFDLEQPLTAAVWRGVHDMKAAIRYFRSTVDNENPYRLDPEEVYLAGSSAGGFICLHHAYLDNEGEIPALIDFSDPSLGGALEGFSGNPGYPTDVKGIVNIAGAIKDTTWINPGDTPICNFHGTGDTTVPFDQDIISLGGFPVTEVNGSNAIDQRVNLVGIPNCFEIYELQGHVPHVSNAFYYDTTLSITVNFLSHLHCGVELDCDYREIENLVSVEELSSAFSNAKVFPNPSNGELEFTGMDTQEIDFLQIFDNAGREVQVNLADLKNNQRLHLPHLASGTYSIHIRSDKEVKTIRWMKL